MSEERLLIPYPNAAHLLGVGMTTLKQRVGSGDLASVAQGSRRYITRRSIEQYVARLPTGHGLTGRDTEAVARAAHARAAKARPILPMAMPEPVAPRRRALPSLPNNQ